MAGAKPSRLRNHLQSIRLNAPDDSTLHPRSSPDAYVVFGEVAVDGDLQVGHTPEDAASDALAGDLGEEAFDEIQPRRRGRPEMQTEPGMLREPPLYVRMLVGGVVVCHQMQVDIRLAH